MQRDYFGATALHMAAIHPNVKGLSGILKCVKPAEIDVQDSSLVSKVIDANIYRNASEVIVLKKLSDLLLVTLFFCI